MLKTKFKIKKLKLKSFNNEYEWNRLKKVPEEIFSYHDEYYSFYSSNWDLLLKHTTDWSFKY